MSRRRERGAGSGALLVVLVFMIACGGVAWVSMGMATRDQWPVRWLEVDGAFERISAEQVRASLAPLAVGSYFTVDLGAIRDAAYRQPWVASATVRKVWPDTVSVQVFEYQPAAHWTGGRLVSDHGEVFQVPGADEIQGLPWLEGPDPQLETVFTAWRDFNNRLLPTGEEIYRLRLDARGSWFLELQSGTEVHIGRQSARARLDRLVASWPALMNGRALPPRLIDLRYTNGFAVRWPAAKEQYAGTYGEKSR